MENNLLSQLLIGKTVEVELIGRRFETGLGVQDAATPAGCLTYQVADGSRRVTALPYVRLLDTPDPATTTLKNSLIAVWDTLPVEVRAMFRPTKTAVLDALNDGQRDEAHLLISAAAVPPELEPLKSQLLALLSGPAGAS